MEKTDINIQASSFTNFGKRFLFHIIVLSLLLFVAIFPFTAQAQEVIKAGETLNLKRCIEIALKKHPNIISAASSMDVNASKVGQAKAGYYPQLNWSSNYNRKYPTYTLSRLGVSTKSNDSYNEYSTSLMLSQNILDFEKTKTQVEIQNMNLDASRADLDNISSQVILGVKQSYYGFLQAKRAGAVAAETVRQFQRQLERAKGFFEVGVKPKFDVTKATVDLSNAKLNLLKAENTLQMARVNLNKAMGIPDAPEYSIEDNFTFAKYEMPFQEALKKAYENRPDLQSIIAKKEAAQKAIELAKKGYYPTLSGNASYNYGGQDFPLDKTWNVGATVTFPIFNGFSTKYQVEEARSNLDVLHAGEATLRQSINLEVQQAYLTLKEAEDRISAADLTVKQAADNYELANGRYESGVGNSIEVTDALLTLSNAKTSYLTAIYDYKTAQAGIEKATGIK